ncbi:hypothetical protein [Lyngbya confervoides]|uniref:Uncharacterized protein n=1 Tax=Lyngbya confervoides BDU141951 TaxID=1574623 RepID=A0ABD4T6Q9_9CYAN|nr:hypothetical protein [Lyngbya confervoides]MCM1984245.1 hypothetical protein [Lyngbya confervoides BDU141951]
MIGSPLRGHVQENQFKGEALAIAWGGNPWDEIPTAEFTWDQQGHLKLDQGKVVISKRERDTVIDWILFSQASLDVSAFYPYAQARMTQPEQLCDWPKLPASNHEKAAIAL